MDFFVRFLLGFGLSITALFLILLVLIQRGRGGGLAGALGGMGGQSAFGTKAGDTFTKITIGVAAVWIILCIVAINVLGRQRTLFSSSLGTAAPQSVAPMTPAESTIPADSEAATDAPAAESKAPTDTSPPAAESAASGGAATQPSAAAEEPPAAK
ncbi:MAG: preprotein translocase subunit SecG [Planctomycetia bacterium]